MDRFDFKLVGKKEMFVPYNAYAAVYQAKQDDLLKPNHLNPDLVRWELHRVWVVEATLKRRQAPRLQQAHLLPRRGLLGGAGQRRVRRARPALSHRLRLHGAELRPARAVHRHVRPLRPGVAHLLADRLHRRDRRPAATPSRCPSASGRPTRWPAPASADAHASKGDSHATAHPPARRLPRRACCRSPPVPPLPAAAPTRLARRARHAGA